MRLEVGILGALEVRADGRPVKVAPGKQRALLVLLSLHAPQPISADAAAEQLWPDAGAGQALRTLRVTVSRLRRSLGEAAGKLETLRLGYRLDVSNDCLDASRFEDLVKAAQRARRTEDAAAAARLLEEALALWRGPPLSDMAAEHSLKVRSRGSTTFG